MSQPFYVSPEQVMKDRADYARKGIARGRSLVALECADGVLLLAENPSRTLFKISELYDRIAFAGVGKYNEFQSLKIGGVRLADLKGYQYSREDVTANGIANVYAQTLGQVFTHEMKPYEVEILVAQVSGDPDEPNELFRILYDGTVIDEHSFTVLGGQAETIMEVLKQAYESGMDLAAATRLGARVLGEDQQTAPPADQLEVASAGPQPAPAHVPPDQGRRARSTAERLTGGHTLSRRRRAHRRAGRRVRCRGGAATPTTAACCTIHDAGCGSAPVVNVRSQASHGVASARVASASHAVAIRASARVGVQGRLRPAASGRVGVKRREVDPRLIEREREGTRELLEHRRDGHRVFEHGRGLRIRSDAELIGRDPGQRFAVPARERADGQDRVRDGDRLLGAGRRLARPHQCGNRCASGAIAATTTTTRTIQNGQVSGRER